MSFLGKASLFLVVGMLVASYCLSLASLMTEEVVVVAFWLDMLWAFGSSWIFIWNAPHLIIELGVFFLSLIFACSIISYLLLSVL